MVRIEEQQEEQDDQHAAAAGAGDSPGTPSSISSDHTFHGFSPLHNQPPRSPSLSPIHTPPPAPSPTTLVPYSSVPTTTNRLVHDQPEVVTKTEVDDAQTGVLAGGEDGDGGRYHHQEKQKKTQQPRRRQQRDSGVIAGRQKMAKRVGLGLRVCEFVVCLVSFSVMAADQNRGWAVDSFHRYIEFRYSMTVNVIGFGYATLQGLDLLYQLTTGKNLVRSKFRYYFDFALDQILAYLLLSASSSAFTRVEDWISNWGKDKFPAMASASVGVSFVSFAAFAMSSLISGYILCTHRFT